MSIKKLPQYLINKLKAGEIVERPSSVVKELLENALDAGSDKIVIEILDGGKKLIKITDNGSGIAFDDLSLTIERYATSKIQKEDDLYNISSFGFRGEALASISEISKFKIQTKQIDDKIGNEIIKIGKDIYTKQISFPQDKGTIVYVEDIFFNTPGRLKFLKSSQTEWNYIKDIFINFALFHYDKEFVLIKDGKVNLNFLKTDSLYSRILDVYKKDWEKNLQYFEEKSENISVFGVCSDSMLRFQTQDFIKIYVNKRPVHDKIIRKSIFDVYERQIPKGEYPLVVLFLDIDPKQLDVNVHPRKLEVKFLDPGSLYNYISNILKKIIGENRVGSADFRVSQEFYKTENKAPLPTQNLFNGGSFDRQFISKENTQIFDFNKNDFKIIGQLWDSYIICEREDGVYLVDQHALAERIIFEQLNKKVNDENIKSSLLLSPIGVEFPKNLEIEQKLEDLNNLGFDVSLFGENKIMIYSIPQIFETYKIDFELLFNKIIYLEKISLEKILNEIFATKACKASINAGEKLSYLEMEKLIKDGIEEVEGLFACQHGRPSVIRLEKQTIENLFDR